MTASKTTGVAAVVAIGVISASILWVGIRWAALGKQSETWDERNGVVRSHETASAISKGSFVTSVRIDYEYTHAGKTYRGNRICYGGPEKDRVGLIRFSSESNLVVFVNPKSPGESVLVPGVTWAAKALLGLGGFLISVLFLVLRQLRAIVT